MIKTRILVAGCACALAGMLNAPLLHADDLEQNLLAKWTFKNGSLKSEVGDFTLIEGGRKGTVEPGDGSVTLRDHKYLIVPEICSATYPDLAKGITIWARMKFDEFPVEHEANVMSLQSVPKDGSWDSITMALLYRGTDDGNSNPGLGFLAKLPNDVELGVGPSRFYPVAAGEFFNVALVFDGAAHTATMWVNGHPVTSERRDAETLKEFAAFAIGSLTAQGHPCTVTFEEVRIYSTVLGPQWLDEIKPSKE